MQVPGVDIISSESLAQSESLYDLIEMYVSRFAGERSMSLLMVPLRYQKILFTKLQCESRGAYMNWHDLLTQKAISGRVRVTYCRAHITKLYKAGSLEHLSHACLACNG